MRTRRLTGRAEGCADPATRCDRRDASAILARPWNKEERCSGRIRSGGRGRVGPYQTGGGIGVPVDFACAAFLLPIFMLSQPFLEPLRARREPFADDRRRTRRWRQRPASVPVRRAVAPPGASG
jgi:hypothetical protein